MADATGRNIVLLSDGTGNSAGKLFKTNVWRVYDALDLSNASQIASYDDGVGTSSIKPLAIFGGAVGWGLKRNVLALYTFLCLNYRPGDRIYAFGFSRGAFTIRVLINFVLSQRLVADWSSNDDLRRKALRLYRKFRVEMTVYYGLHTLARPIRDAFVFLQDLMRGQRRELREIQTVEVPEIELLGLWDTVDAYGLPINELGKGVDQWIWPLSLNDKELDPRINKACHALSIDDKRTTFHPLLWDECDAPLHDHTDDERLTQVWFAGVHANVGGGYPDDSLSYVPLRWMIEEATKRGVRFSRLALAALEVKVSPYGRIYNPRAGLGAYYRYDPRRLDPPRDRQQACIPSPKIHETVVWRMAMGTDAYAPLSLPNDLRIVTDARPKLEKPSGGAPDAGDAGATVKNILSFDDYRHAVQNEGDLFGAPAGKHADTHRRKRAAEDFGSLVLPDARTLDLIWDTVWWRRVAYFATLISTAVLLLYPAFFDADTQRAGDNPITRVAGLATGLLPTVAHPWIDSFRSDPFTIVLLAAMTGMFALWGALIDRRIHDRALAAWNGKSRASRFHWFQDSLRQRFAAVTMTIMLFPLSAVLGIMALFLKQFEVGIGLLIVAILSLLPVLISVIYTFVLWRMRKRGLAEKTEIRGLGLWTASKLRQSVLTAGPYRFFAWHILPTLFAIALVAASLVAISRIAFDFTDSGGWVCAGQRSAELPKDGWSLNFKPDDPCQPANIRLKAKVKYRIDIVGWWDWTDDGIAVAPRGMSSLSVGWHKLAMLPLRRKLARPWFVVIARVNNHGDEEYPLTTGTNEITPTRDGELYFYVNEAVVGMLGYGRYYSDNKGTATIKITKVGETPAP